MIYALCALFFILFVICFYVSYKSLRLNRMYEEFYNSSSEEMSMIIEAISTIVDRRPLLTDDTDVQQLLKGLKLAHNILNQYATVKERKQN